MPGPEQVDDLLPRPEDVTVFERKLKQEWRSLLLEESGVAAVQPSDKSSYLFRPRALSALQLNVDPDTLVRRAGDSLGDFRLERLIGQGAMGQVWEALQVSLQRQVALKLIRPDRVTPDLLRFFRREGRAGGRLQHPGIVAVHAMGQTEGVHWIAQELVEGECTLHDFLDEVESFADMPGDYDRRIALFFYQLAEGLQFAHDAGVIHRDLKPQNVLVAPDDRPKISDFGVARILDEGTLTQEGSLQGTPRYMSPEQVLGISEHIGPASDQFSLGAMLYKALTLEDATRENSLHAVLHAVTKVSPIRPTKIRPQLSLDLEAIVMKALEKVPADRYASLREFQADLGSYLDGRATAARQITTCQRALKWVRRNPVPSTVVAVLVVLAASIGLLLGALGDSKEQTEQKQWRIHVIEGRRHLERGNPSLATSSFMQAAASLPSSPQSPILLASIAARGARYRKAEEHLKQAEELGFQPADAGSTNAEHQYLRGLYLFARGRQPRYEDAAVALTRALELDVTLQDAWYPLYQIRAAQGRHSEAADALAEYMKGLTIGDPQAKLADALIAEESGELAESRRLLEDRNQLDQSFEASRALGRVCLQLGDYLAAHKALTAAVSVEPLDSDSQYNLAFADFQLAATCQDGERVAWLDLSETAANEALGVEHSKADTLWLLSLIEVYRGLRAGGPAREEFRQHSPQDERLLDLDAIPLLDQAKSLWDRGEYEASVSVYREVLALGLDHVTALTMIANDLSFVGSEAADLEGLELLDRAFARWLETRREIAESSRIELAHDREDREVTDQALLVTRYVLAARQKQIAKALETKEALETYLLEAPFHSQAESLTYAEALVVDCPEELKDRDRARALLEGFKASAEIIPEAAAEQFRSTLERIEQGLK